MRPRDLAWRLPAGLAALVFISLVLSLWHVAWVPAIVVPGLLALTVLTLFRPDAALLVLAVLVPIVMWIGRRWHPNVSWPEVLVVAVAAGYCARSLRREDEAHDGLAEPLLLALVIVGASLAVQFLIEAWRTGAGPVRTYLWQLLRSEYFVLSSAAVDAAMRLLEGFILLKMAADAARRAPAFPRRFGAALATGATLAALVNLWRIWEGARRLESPLAAFGRYLLTLRFNAHYGDVNAAGSYFVMALLVTLGLALLPRARAARAWWLPILVIASSVWITGSRAAMASGAVAALLAGIFSLRRLMGGRSRRALLAGAVVVALLVVGLVARYGPDRDNQSSLGAAFQIRYELTRMGLKMFASSPAFGIGTGEFMARSGEFASPELFRIFPTAVHENAHNNFLQIAAELGLAGLFALLWTLVVIGRSGLTLLRADSQTVLARSMVTGTLAFVLSWFSGHPLLIDEPSFCFWMLAGVVCGWGAVTAPRPTAPLAKWIVAVLAVAVLISIPFRVEQHRDDFDLEHRGIGLSAWQAAFEGVRYRLAGATSGVFVPTAVQSITVPLRAATPGRDIHVELRFDGRLANVVTVPADRWHMLRLILPQERNPPRFKRLDLRVTDPNPGDTSTLMIGKVETR